MLNPPCIRLRGLKISVRHFSGWHLLGDVGEAIALWLVQFPREQLSDESAAGAFVRTLTNHAECGVLRDKARGFIDGRDLSFCEDSDFHWAEKCQSVVRLAWREGYLLQNDM